MPHRLKWLTPAVRFVDDSGTSDHDSDSDSKLAERLERPDPNSSLMPIVMGDFGGKRLNEPKLLDLSDEIRSHLTGDATLGPRGEMVNKVLRELVRDEGVAVPAVSFATIQNARLDKLLFAMLTLGHHQASVHLRPRINIVMAERLQRLWMARFREQYFNIDQTRHEDLSKSRRLKEVVFNVPARNSQELWQAGKCETVSALEWNIQFKPGH